MVLIFGSRAYQFHFLIKNNNGCLCADVIALIFSL